MQCVGYFEDLQILRLVFLAISVKKIPTATKIRGDWRGKTLKD